MVAWSRSLDDEAARELGVERCATVRDLCARAVLLDHGNMVYDGAPTQAIRLVRDAWNEKAEEEAEAAAAKAEATGGAAPAYTPMKITDVVITDGAGNPKDTFKPGDSFGVECRFERMDQAVAAE